MLTLRTLLEEMDLALATGDESADAPVRWVHITELPDPTPWLSGGELILTTGLQLTSAERQRQFVRRLADHQLSGLGFGVGFEHDELPPALVDEAAKHGFPVFEVPYDLPFIAVTEKAFARLVNEQYEVLQRGIAIHKRLERLVIEERGLDELVRALAAALGGTVTVIDAHGDADRPPDVPARAARGRAGHRAGRGAFRAGGARGRALARPPSWRPSTPRWPAGRWCFRCTRAGAARRGRGCSPPATPAASATSSG